jgi:hypothetical protein
LADWSASASALRPRSVISIEMLDGPAGVIWA